MAGTRIASAMARRLSAQGPMLGCAALLNAAPVVVPKATGGFWCRTNHSAAAALEEDPFVVLGLCRSATRAQLHKPVGIHD